MMGVQALPWRKRIYRGLRSHGLPWLAILAIVLRLPFAPGTMPGSGTYIALCPSGLTRHQVELLFPVQHDMHAHHGMHAASDDSSGPKHEHGDGYCEFTVYSFADVVLPFVVQLSRFLVMVDSVLPPISVVAAPMRFYEARGPPARSTQH